MEHRPSWLGADWAKAPRHRPLPRRAACATPHRGTHLFFTHPVGFHQPRTYDGQRLAAMGLLAYKDLSAGRICIFYRGSLPATWLSQER